jgi:hypothetical protein
MAKHVDCCIMAAVHAATGVNFDTEVMAKERLRLPARMKGGGIKRVMDTWYPAFLGALLDILPRCMDRKDNNGEITKGTYSDQLTAVIGEGAFDEAGHMNAQFLTPVANWRPRGLDRTPRRCRRHETHYDTKQLTTTASMKEHKRKKRRRGWVYLRSRHPQGSGTEAQQSERIKGGWRLPSLTVDSRHRMHRGQKKGDRNKKKHTDIRRRRMSQRRTWTRYWRQLSRLSHSRSEKRRQNRGML